jgi:hypothetical protein
MLWMFTDSVIGIAARERRVRRAAKPPRITQIFLNAGHSKNLHCKRSGSCFLSKILGHSHAKEICVIRVICGYKFFLVNPWVSGRRWVAPELNDPQIPQIPQIFSEQGLCGVLSDYADHTSLLYLAVVAAPPRYVI